MMSTNPMLCSKWRRAIVDRDPALQRAFALCYGTTNIDARTALIRRVLDSFVERFGDLPVRVVRCPARINLRGMHVDTHGGYLNLMTHQREVVVVSAASAGRESNVVNINAQFPEICSESGRWRSHQAFPSSWQSFITHPDVQQHVTARRGLWSNYIDGSTLRTQHEWPNECLNGICAAVGSDIPRGASLSSSTALSLSIFMSQCAWNNRALFAERLIDVAQDIEWYTGARIGTSDQSGMLLPGVNELINFAPVGQSSAASALRRIPFPNDLAVLVIDSHTDRSISGAEQLDYTRNRFAYSLALDILRQEMHKSGVALGQLEQFTSLSEFAAPKLDAVGGVRALYGWLGRVPQCLSLEDLRTRYTLPLLEETYDRYFSPLPETERPIQFAIRGPLLFGLAESERARLFVDALLQGDHEVTGYYMTLGHDGDRLFDAMGMPWSHDVSDEALRLLAARETPMARVPGAYGASSRALDALVDSAIHAGALGASLTGAGIAGAVIALVEAAYAQRIADGIRQYIGSEEYHSIAPRSASLSEDELRESVVINCAPSSAGEITIT
ncbi:MAG: hypothetical protein IT367_00745 [Candidatus Hydrogenedentes bacterium]|nr:hypothetical protein [Candidatus Hydrogenedentota bacterium]